MVNIAVTSVGSGIGQAVLRSLALSEFDHSVTGLDARPYNSGIHWVQHARIVPEVRHRDAYRERLLSVVDEQRIDVLVPGLDNELPVLSALRAELAESGCTVLVSDEPVVRLSADKLAFANWAAERSLPFVTTVSLPEARDRPGDLDYPVVVKPRGGSASHGVRLVTSPDVLAALAGDDQWIVQPYLEPRLLDGSRANLESAAPDSIEQSHEISAQYVLGDGGAVLGAFVSLNWLKLGVPVRIEPLLDASWTDAGLHVAEQLGSLGARGPLNLQGRVTPDRGVQFFEMNARFTGITGVRALLGFREVEAAIHALHHADETRARSALKVVEPLVGFRHVGDMVVPRTRIEHLVDVGASSLAPRPSGSRVAVSGASGYVGMTTIQHLLDGGSSEVHAIVRTAAAGHELLRLVRADERLHVHVLDLLDREMELPAVDTMLHLAAVRAVGESPEFLYEVNVEGTRRLLQAARDAGAGRFVYLSSQAVYGVARRPPWTEAMQARPETAYATSKWLGELMCRDEVANGLEHVVLRAARAFGLAPGMRWAELPHQFAAKTAKAEPILVHGDGSQRLDLLHVQDLGAALARAADARSALPGRVVLNLGGGHPVSVRALALECVSAARQLGIAEPRIEFLDSTGRGPDFGMDIRRARARLDWSPSTALSDAVRELVRAALPG